MKEPLGSRVTALEDRCQRLENEAYKQVGYLWALGAVFATLGAELNPAKRPADFELRLEPARAIGLARPITDEQLRRVDAGIEEIAAAFRRALQIPLENLS